VFGSCFSGLVSGCFRKARKERTTKSQKREKKACGNRERRGNDQLTNPDRETPKEDKAVSMGPGEKRRARGGEPQKEGRIKRPGNMQTQLRGGKEEANRQVKKRAVSGGRQSQTKKKPVIRTTHEREKKNTTDGNDLPGEANPDHLSKLGWEGGKSPGEGRHDCPELLISERGKKIFAGYLHGTRTSIGKNGGGTSRTQGGVLCLVSRRVR